MPRACGTGSVRVDAIVCVLATCRMNKLRVKYALFCLKGAVMTRLDDLEVRARLLIGEFGRAASVHGKAMLGKGSACEESPKNTGFVRDDDSGARLEEAAIALRGATGRYRGRNASLQRRVLPPRGPKEGQRGVNRGA